MEGCISNQIIKCSSWPPKLLKKLLKQCPGRVTRREDLAASLPTAGSVLWGGQGAAVGSSS